MAVSIHASNWTDALKKSIQFRSLLTIAAWKIFRPLPTLHVLNVLFKRFQLLRLYNVGDKWMDMEQWLNYTEWEMQK